MVFRSTYLLLMFRYRFYIENRQLWLIHHFVCTHGKSEWNSDVDEDDVIAKHWNSVIMSASNATIVVKTLDTETIFLNWRSIQYSIKSERLLLSIELSRKSRWRVYCLNRFFDFLQWNGCKTLTIVGEKLSTISCFISIQLRKILMLT